MLGRVKQKFGWHSFRLSGILLLMMVWLAAAVPAEANPEPEEVSSQAGGAEEARPDNFTSKGKEAAAQAQAAPCKGLKPFNNIEELLNQFYINLDSDCLFKMPVAELEKIWGTKILSAEAPKPYFPLEFYDKPYKSEKDAFYLVAGPSRTGIGREFYIRITKEYAEKYGNLLPFGIDSKLIPESIFAKKSYYRKVIWEAPDPYYLKAGYVTLDATEYSEITEINLTYTPPQPVPENPVSASALAGAEAPALSQVKTAPCVGLKPFNNLDELLYQFYINLDSNCLFKMPVEELERIWGLKITTGRLAVHTDNNSNHNIQQYIFKDTFYVAKMSEMSDKGPNAVSTFTIFMSREYHEEYGSLFPEGNYPRLLPKPLKKHYRIWKEPPRISDSDLDRASYRPPKIMAGKYRDINCKYYWLNSDQTRMIKFYVNFGAVESIYIYNYLDPEFVMEMKRRKTWP